MLILQNRWRIEGKQLVYYGLRSGENTTKNRIKLSQKDIKWISNNSDNKKFSNKIKFLIDNKILINEIDYKIDKKGFHDAKFCVNCCANDYTISGLEFDNESVCPICQHYDELKKLVSVNPIIENVPHNNKGMYDIAIFYTGGKDSTYLLYYLANVMKLRVLALTWQMPFMSDSAKQSMVNAKQKISNVTFVDWQMSNEDLSKFYKKLFQLQNNTCACPSLAYLLFFPMLSSMRVPYLVLGNEPSQMKNLYFNNIAPKIAFKYHTSKTLEFLLNLTRVLTFKKPVKLAQFGYLMVVKQLIYGENFIKKKFTDKMATLDNLTIALDEIPGIKSNIKRAIKDADRKGSMPSFVHLDMNKLGGGVYNWDIIKQTLIKEVGWVDCKECGKGLHTSCKVEKAKEYSQFLAFRNMETTTIPFSAIELSCAVNEGAISRDKAIEEMKMHCGFTLTEPVEHCKMKEYIDKFSR